MRSRLSLLTLSRLLLSLVLVYSVKAQSRRLTVKDPEAIDLKRGATVVQTTSVVVEPGSHVNTNQPRSEFLVPLRLVWESGPLSVSSIEYPPGEELQVGPDKLLVLTGAFIIRTEFKAAQSALPGNTLLKGKLRYQACNEQMCFRPATVDISLPVTIQ